MWENMKYRTIPFGYTLTDGIIAVHLQEKKTIEIICDAYLSGASLLHIAKRLNERKIEYQPGVTGWNKARIKRIIEDTRYLGMDPYPAILDRDKFNAMQQRKAEKNTQKDLDRSAPIYQIGVPVRCPICGYAMRRKCDIRLSVIQRWTCQNPDCKRSMAKADEELIGEITELLNMTIADPGTIQIPVATDDLADSEIQKIDNEIDRMLNAGTPDKGTLRYAMLRRVSLAYANIPDEIYISKQLRADFANAKPLSSFSSDLFHKTVKAILFHEDGTVGILLINDQEIRKAKSNGKDRAAAESGTANPCDS